MPNVYHGVYSIDFTPPVVLNEDPYDGETGVSLTANIQFDVIDLDSGVDIDTIDVSVEGDDAIINGVFQAPSFSGTITAISDGYHVTIYLTTPFTTLQEVDVLVTASDLNVPRNTLSNYLWTFTTKSIVIPDHLIKYNIYYRPANRPDWIKSNPEPLNHNLEGNVYTIPSLAEGVTYVVAIVAGIVQNSRFIPLMKQPLTPADIGAGDINIIENFPRYLVKTLRS